jgi:ABC-type phosphate/phosphonate transport system substrate-binding protein
MRAANHGVFHAGMYAPSDVHKAAWQAWFSALTESYLNRHYNSVELGFSVNEQAYTAANVIAAQTCGYPFVTRWADTHEPLALPQFDVPGCTPGTGQYSSWFITRADHTGTSLRQFANSRVAMNSKNSNSGMNVLRYAISQFTSRQTFFSECTLTGGHIQSMRSVAEGRADLAAIDVVTYALINELEPALCRRLKIIGQSELTTGLPFIFTKHSNIDRDELRAAMNQAVTLMDSEARKLLHLNGFAPVAAKDYAKIKQLEDDAIAAGYPELR